MNTFIVNLFGGPGAGKSTIAAQLFSDLKREGHTCELVTEFAKDLVWEGNTKALGEQTYIFGNQSYRIYRAVGQVECIVTDSPLLMSPYYAKNLSYFEELRKLAIKVHSQYKNIDIFLNRNHPYEQEGRYQTERQADVASDEIREYMEKCLNETGGRHFEVDSTEYDKVKEIVKMYLK